MNRIKPYFFAAAVALGGLLNAGSAVAQDWNRAETARLELNVSRGLGGGPIEKGTGSLGIAASPIPNTISSQEFSEVSYTVTLDLTGAPGGVASFALDGLFTTMTGGRAKGAIFADLFQGSQTIPGTLNGGPGPTWNCNGFSSFTCTTMAGDLAEGTHQFTFIGAIGSKGVPGSVDMELSTASVSALPITATVIVTAPGGATLDFAGSVDPVNPAPLDPVDLVLDVTNTSGTAFAGPFTVSLFGSSNLTLPTSFNDANFNCNQLVTDQLDCDYMNGLLAPGAGVTLRVPVNAPGGATAFSTQADLQVDSLDTRVTPGTIVLSGDTSTFLDFNLIAPTGAVAFGDPMVFTATVINTGPAPARNVIFDLIGDDNQFSNTATFVSATGANWSCSDGFMMNAQGKTETGRGRRKGSGTTVFCDFGVDLPAGQSSSPVTITINAPSANGVNLFTVSPFAGAANDAAGSSPTSQDVVIVPATDVSILKTAAVANTTVGNQINYTLEVRNNGPVDIDKNEYTIVDTLPAEVSFVSSSNTSYTCTDSGGVVTCTYTDSPDFLLNGDSDVIELTVSADSPGATVNSVDVNLLGPTIDTNTSNNTDTANVQIAGSADLSLTKNASVSTIGTGGSFTYTLTVNNAGPNAPPSFTVTDTLPAEVSFDGFTGADFSCSEASGTVTCDYVGTPLGIGAAASVDIDVTAQTDGTANNNASVAITAPDVDPVTSNNTASASVVITLPTADLSLAKTVSAPTVDIGSAFSYTLTVSNAGPDDAMAFSVTDSLPPGVSYDGFSGADFTCAEASGTVTCDYAGAGLANGASTALDLNVTAQTDGLSNNTATVILASPAIDPVTGNDTANVDVTINPQADLALTKSASVSSATVGDIFDWVLTVTNNGSAAADGFTVTDTLPTQTTFNALVAPDFTCTTAGSDISCTWSGTAPLANGANSQITVTVDADSPGTANNTASVTAAAVAPDLNLANNTATASVVVNAPPMTTIVTTLVDDPDPVEPEGDFTFAATLTNQGPSPANNLFAVFQLEPGVVFNGSTQVKGGGGWSCTLLSGPLDKGSQTGGGNIVDCFNPGPLTVTGTTTVTLDLTAPDVPGVIVTGVEIGADEFGPDILSETTTVGADVDLSITKLASQETVEVGEDFSYTISVSNALGTADAIVVSDSISPQLAVQSITGQNWSCQQFQNTFQCSYTGQPLNAGDTSSVLTFNVRAMNAGEIDNTARVSSDQNDVNPSDNSALVSVTVGGTDAVDLVLTKASLPASVAAGAQFQYMLTVENLGPSQATGVIVSDQLPAGVQFISGGATGWTCVDNAGLVQCSRDGVVLPEVGPDALMLTVQAPDAPGVLQNTASVTSDQPETNSPDNTASATTTVLEAGPDVSVTKVVDQPTARRGDLLTYTIDVTNLSDEAATGVTVTDALPQGLTLVDVIAPNWDCQVTSQSVTCTLMGDLGPVASAMLTLTGRTTVSTGVIANQALVTTTSIDPNTDNNGSTAETTLVGDPLPSNLSITIDDSVDPVLTEEGFDYLITIANSGPGSAGDFAVTGDIPPGLSVGQIVAPDLLDCSADGGRLVCRSVELLPPNDERLITLPVVAPAEAADLAFTVEIQFTGLGVDEDGTDNTDTEQTTVRLTPTADELEEQLLTALGEIDDPLVRNNLAPTAELCANPPPGVTDLCRAIADALDDGRSGEVAEAIRQIIGAPAIAQHTSMVEASSTQFNNMFNRFSQNRQSQGASNGGTVNIDGLAFRYGNEVLPLSYMQAGESDEPRVDPNGLVKPWAFFVNGTISGGERDPTTREVGFDFDTRGLTVGVDYRFSSKLIGGAALGYTNFDSQIQGGGSLESDGVMLHLFGNYYPTDRLYIDALVSVGNVDFDQRRSIAFSIGDLTVDELALGSTDSDMLAGALAVGYNYNSGSWNFTPSGSISFLDADIDAFNETGTDLGLAYTEQDVESLIFSANFSVSKIISLSRGILTPTFDVSYLHESANDSNDFNTQVLGGPAGASFLVEADNPDRNYASAGIGLVFVGANGKQAFLSYRNILGLSGFSRWTVNAGVRFEF